MFKLSLKTSSFKTGQFSTSKFYEIFSQTKMSKTKGHKLDCIYYSHLINSMNNENLTEIHSFDKSW